MRKVLLLMLCLSLAGCGGGGKSAMNAMNPGTWFAKKPQPAPVETKTAEVSPTWPAKSPTAAAPAVPTEALDPVIEGPTRVQMDVYQLSVPFGTVSKNEAFWKRIDEQCVDVATYDVIFK